MTKIEKVSAAIAAIIVTLATIAICAGISSGIRSDVLYSECLKSNERIAKLPNSDHILQVCWR